jgi:hypothetical protein
MRNGFPVVEGYRTLLLLLMEVALTLLAQTFFAAASETYFCHFHDADVVTVDRAVISNKLNHNLSVLYEITIQGNTAFHENNDEFGKAVRAKDFIYIESPIKLGSRGAPSGVDVTTIFLGVPMGPGEFFAAEARHSLSNTGAIASTLYGKCMLR